MHHQDRTDGSRLTNAKPSAIYRLRPHLPADAPLPLNGNTPPANLGIEIAPQAQLEGLLATLEQGDKGKGKEVAERVDVGKVAEKVVKNVSHSQSPYSVNLVLIQRAMLIVTAVQLPTFLWRRCQAHVSQPTSGHYGFRQGHWDDGADMNRPETPIPLSVFQQWYNNFTRKVQNDRGAAFLDRED